MPGTSHLDHGGGRRRGGGRGEAEGAKSSEPRLPTVLWRLAATGAAREAVVQAQQEAAAAPAVVSRRRARRLGPSAAPL